MRVKIIGLGGIGGCLLPILAKFLSYQHRESESHELTLIDGDSYEDKNAARQFFQDFGNKAEVSLKRIEGYPNILGEAISEYVTSDNIISLIRPEDVVFLCVDNHNVRKLVSDRFQEIENGILISGGNEYTDGNVQIFIRKNDCTVTLPLTNSRHPEIANPKDKNPADMSCEELSESSPQLIIMNNKIAATMLCAFYAYLQKQVTYSEIYCDILTGSCRAVQLAGSNELLDNVLA